MSKLKWVEKNPMMTLIVYTLTVAGVVGGFSYFLLDENKDKKHQSEVNLYKSQIENYEQRIEVIEKDSKRIEEERDKYLSWLVENPSTFKYLESKLDALEKERLSVEVDSIQVKPVIFKDHVEFKIHKSGNSYYVQEIDLFIGIKRINALKEVSGKIQFPNNKSEEFINKTAGEVWYFEFKKQEYKLMLSEVDFVGDAVHFMVIRSVE